MRLDIILRHSFAVTIHKSEIALRERVALIGGQSKPFQRFGIVLRHTFTTAIEETQFILSTGITQFSQCKEKSHRRWIVISFHCRKCVVPNVLRTFGHCWRSNAQRQNDYRDCLEVHFSCPATLRKMALWLPCIAVLIKWRSRRGPSWSCWHPPILFFRASPHDPEYIVRQRSLQCLRFIPRRAHPDITFLISRQDHRHGLGMDRLDDGVRCSRQKAVDLMRPRDRFRLRAVAHSVVSLRCRIWLLSGT